jgi:hypothetical protein
MAEIVNLRLARRRRAREEAAAAARENRVRFGRTKAAKAMDAAERTRHDGAVDGARLDDRTPRRD